LPDERGWNHIDKKWVCDVIFTVDSVGFEQMLNNALQERRARLDQSQDSIIEMRPEFANAL
jgi:hypothetical protein